MPLRPPGERVPGDQILERLGGAVRGFKDGMKDSSADKHSESGSSPQSQLGGRTIEGEVKDKAKT